MLDFGLFFFFFFIHKNKFRTRILLSWNSPCLEKREMILGSVTTGLNILKHPSLNWLARAWLLNKMPRLNMKKSKQLYKCGRAFAKRVISDSVFNRVITEKKIAAELKQQNISIYIFYILFIHIYSYIHLYIYLYTWEFIFCKFITAAPIIEIMTNVCLHPNAIPHEYLDANTSSFWWSLKENLWYEKNQADLSTSIPFNSKNYNYN